MSKRDLVLNIIRTCTKAEAEWARELGECGSIHWDPPVGWVCHLSAQHPGPCAPPVPVGEPR